MTNPQAIGIAAAARETGLSPHTLRAWEERYGFPAPRRATNGERLYAPEEVRKLQLIRRLGERGHRPGRIVRLPVADMERLLGEAGDEGTAAGTADDFQTYLECLTNPSVAQLRRRLRSALVRQGLSRFIVDTVGPLSLQVGRWWKAGRIEIFQEHLFSQEIERLLREAMAPLEEYRPTRIVLTTFPSERHGLGLLMAEALLRLEGAACVPMGVETPPAEIVKLVQQSGAGIVALSFSAAYDDPNGRRLLMGLRHDLPPEVLLWAGGGGAGKVARSLRRVDVFRDLGAMVAAFRRQAAEPP